MTKNNFTNLIIKLESGKYKNILQYKFLGFIFSTGLIIMLIYIFFHKSINTYFIISSLMFLSVALFVTNVIYLRFSKHLNIHKHDLTAHSPTILYKHVYTDPLTNLPNRKKLIQDIEKNKKFELILINIDDFKAINDLYGSKVGDKVLIEIANRLKHFIEEPNVYMTYKLHADEFAVLLKKTDKSKTLETVRSINRSIKSGLIVNDQEIIAGVSLGIAADEENILSKADTALKTAKEKRKDYVYFDKSMKIEEQSENKLQSIKNLERAIASDNIVPYYQPIIDNRNDEIIKYECLVRLIDHNNEIIRPHQFLDVAKKTKTYSHITKIVALKAFEHFKDCDCKFSINLSVDDLMDKSTVDFICGLLEDYNIHDRVIFEILETEKIGESPEITNFINFIKKLGCKIAIDDFGAGYSNFEYILRLNVDYIKLDSSLIKNIADDRNSQIIVETIVNFTKKLNIETIAEYVHSKNVYDKVKELNIDYSQGYYLGEPMPDIILGHL